MDKLIGFRPPGECIGTYIGEYHLHDMERSQISVAYLACLLTKLYRYSHGLPVKFPAGGLHREGPSEWGLEFKENPKIVLHALPKYFQQWP